MKPEIITRPAWRKLIVAGCLALLMAGCASNGKTSSAPSPSAPAPSAPASAATSSPNAALCADAVALRAAVNNLVHVTVAPGMASEIKSDIASVSASLATFTNDARGQLQAQTSALKNALSTLQTAVGDLTASPSASAVTNVRTALGGVNTAARDLLAAVDTTCPSASPSM
jgi:hypothetical protein